MFSTSLHNNLVRSLLMSLKEGLLKKCCIDEGGSIKFSSATISHHLTFHIIWFDIMEPVALSSVQCLFQFEIHCLPDFTLICKCHLSRSDGNNLQWCKKKDIKNTRDRKWKEGVGGKWQTVKTIYFYIWGFQYLQINLRIAFMGLNTCFLIARQNKCPNPFDNEEMYWHWA